MNGEFEKPKSRFGSSLNQAKGDFGGGGGEGSAPVANKRLSSDRLPETNQAGLIMPSSRICPPSSSPRSWQTSVDHAHAHADGSDMHEMYVEERPVTMQWKDKKKDRALETSPGSSKNKKKEEKPCDMLNSITGTVGQCFVCLAYELHSYTFLFSSQYSPQRPLPLPLLFYPLAVP